MANIYTVGQVSAYIKRMFDSDVVLERIRVSGEVSNCKYNARGHIYFTLKDKDASISAVMFARDTYGLKFRLKDGQKVIVSGRVSTYEPAGTYQVIVSSIEEAGDGELYAKFLALKQELEEMGMFDERYKKPIPSYVKRVGVVTASTGAAIQDIINISHRRNPYVQLVLCPAQVQGIGAAKSIVTAIKTLDQLGDLDVIIVGRGGGSIEDLWAFNEEIVARAIFACNTPVISAVGHETDWTIADWVSDRRAPTPSAAAELAIYRYEDLVDRLTEGMHRLDAAMAQSVKENRLRTESLHRELTALSPEHVLENRRQRLDDWNDRLELLMQQKLSIARHRMQMEATRLEALSPLKKFSSGFSYATISREDGTYALTSVKEVKEKDVIDLQLKDGCIHTQTVSVETIDRGINHDN